MATKKEKVEKKSVTVRLSAPVAAEIEKVASDLGISVNELFRKALGTEMFLLDAKERGEKILLETADKEVREVVMR